MYGTQTQLVGEFVRAEQYVKYKLDFLLLLVDVVKCDVNSKSMYDEQSAGITICRSKTIPKACLGKQLFFFFFFFLNYILLFFKKMFFFFFIIKIIFIFFTTFFNFVTDFLNRQNIISKNKFSRYS
jgi:hypothetical protein